MAASAITVITFNKFSNLNNQGTLKESRNNLGDKLKLASGSQEYQVNLHAIKLEDGDTISRKKNSHLCICNNK